MLKNNRGLTLVEVMIASMVLVVGVVGVMAMTARSTADNTMSFVTSEAFLQAAERIETFMAKEYDDVDLNDDDGDGTHQDISGNRLDGIDDVPVAGATSSANGDFGLNDYPGCTTALQNRGNAWGCTDGPADGTLTKSSANASFTLYWNVAVDYPVKYTKTIRFFVLTPQRSNRPVILEYVKSQGL